MEVIYINTAYFFMLIAFILSEVLYLRLTLITAHIVFIIYALATDNYSVLIWNVVFLLINVVQVIIIFKKRRPVKLNPENEEIYKRDYRCMSRREFLYLWQTGNREVVADKCILKQGANMNDLFYIIDGTVTLKRKDKIIARLTSGDFIAEANIFPDSRVEIDVCAEGRIEYKVFKGEVLENLRKLNPAVLSKLEKLVSRYMTGKLKDALNKKDRHI